jgi:hypothetical protein
MRADPAGLFRRGVVGRSRGHCLVLCGGRCIRVCPLRLAVSVLVYGSFSAVSRAGKWRLSRNGHDGLFIFPFHTFDEHKSKDVQLTNTSPMCHKMIRFATSIDDVVRAALVVNLATGDWSISILVTGR